MLTYAVAYGREACDGDGFGDLMSDTLLHSLRPIILDIAGCRCMLTYADACWRMLTYADAC
jgi:hypothetical protein